MSNTAEHEPKPLIPITQEEMERVEARRNEHPELHREHSWDILKPYREAMTAWADQGGWPVEVVERDDEGYISVIRGDMCRVMFSLDWFIRQGAPWDLPSVAQ